MHPFENTLSVVGAIVLAVVGGIVLLTLFFRGLSWLSAAGAKPESIAIRGVLKKHTFATVYMSGGEKFDRVRFIGFTNSESLKTRLPYELKGMVILEDEQGQRHLVRPRHIREIVIPADADGEFT